MAVYLPFEKPLADLKAKIEELKHFSREKDLNLSEEIARLEEKAARLTQEIYGNLTPWQRVQIARHPERPSTLEIIHALFTHFVELHGDRFYGDDPAMIGGIALFEGEPVTVIGHQKGRDTKENLRRNFGMPHPEGYRKALRLMEQAEKFGRPIITFLNTPGAYPGMAAEERGQSEAIARNLWKMAGFHVPILTIVTGEGASGGALGIGVGNLLYMLENAWYSVISPEGAAALLWKDAGQAQRAAETMKITAQDLFDLGICDRIIPEPMGGSHKDPSWQFEAIREAIREGLSILRSYSGDELVRHRYEKYKRIGHNLSLFPQGINE
ncbi:acetyl-CoA carboxylase (carboxyltransferase alpha subunit) [[Clostridium] ultunense Esp]|uniref:acetyl-CoA carboxylase carboxyltransferase subunit alpha n=1 Tax=Thermicanus aegyptius TaxID=94009 RepID=UPI0002B6EE5E|nr:acetyl-CoA carboxylase carboxyltransferase subunit alpha [Thermicanus aegyptius]CCQ97760.1 acetyl-CoA carboxylase (carboxyltransferase alpha subunit) [[Clostridium] ultunense Esp]